MRTFAIVSVLAVVAIVLSGCAMFDSPESGCKACAANADSGNGWCDNCSKGYTDGTATVCNACATKEGVCDVCAAKMKDG